MKKILYVRMKNEEQTWAINALQEMGYTVVEYELDDGLYVKEENTVWAEVNHMLEESFFYFVISFSFYEIICKACMGTATKYVSWLGTEACVEEKTEHMGNSINYFVVTKQHDYEKLKAIVGTNCLYVPDVCGDVSLMEQMVIKEAESVIYNTINELHLLHRRQSGRKIAFKELDKITDENELIQKTDIFFANMEEEKELNILLKNQLLEYIDKLLEKKSWNAWYEIILWCRRHECRNLRNNFWQFFLLKKCTDIYMEETTQYCEQGVVPSILQMSSFQELSETYFKLLFLLRRLIYGIAAEEEMEVVDYIMARKISVVFIRHVIEHNQLEDKDKVYNRLEELLMNYEQ